MANTKKKKTVSKKITKPTKKNTAYNYNQEVFELDSALNRVKRIKFQQWLYSLIILILFAPLFVRGDTNQAYLSMIIVCLFGLFFSVYIAQSNRILVLLSQIKSILEKKK